MTDSTFPTEPGSGDALRTVIAAAVSALPLIGGPTGVLLDTIRTPLAKRQIEWLNDLAGRLMAVEKFKQAMDEIAGGGSILDAAIEASQIAAKTASEEKRRALVECVVRAVDADSVKRDSIQMTIWRLERMTEWHLRLLRLCYDARAEMARLRKSYAPGMIASMMGLIQAAYPEMGRDEQFAVGVMRDLHAERLITNGEVMTGMSASGVYQRRTTSMGDAIIGDCFGNAE